MGYDYMTRVVVQDRYPIYQREPTRFYLVNEGGRFVWLQRLAVSILRMFGTPELMTRTVGYEDITLDVSSVLNLVDAQFDYCWDNDGCPPALILMGPTQLKEARLEAGEDLNQVFRGNFGPVVNADNPQTLYDIPYAVIPWLDGIVVIPDQVLRRR